MRVDLQRQREDFDTVLADTLAAGWTEQLGHPVHVSAPPRKGQVWHLQPLLSGYFVANCAPEARHFLRDFFRFTRVLWRAPSQWCLGTALASRWGLRATSRPGFSVWPELPGARHLLVLPGNQRVRVFDFARGRCRVLAKAGFATAGMQREIGWRANRVGPFPTIDAWHDGGAWFEEPIWPGVVLSRCPPWRSYRRAVSDALRALDHHTADTEREEDAHQWALGLANTLRSSASSFAERFGVEPEYLRYLDDLVARSAALGTLPTRTTHGDLQPGNILLGPRNGVALLDWEHVGRRFGWYDRMVLALHGRREVPLAARMAAYARGAWTPAPLGRTPEDPEWRRAACALFVLEDTLFYAQESLSGPFRLPSRGLAWLIHEWRRASL